MQSISFFSIAVLDLVSIIINQGVGTVTNVRNERLQAIRLN